MMTTLILASSNAGKLREFRAILAPLNLQCQPQGDYEISDADETGLSFIENAIIKARHASQYTGLPALADDSGVCVDTLGGEPGIYTARYAGTHGDHDANLNKLLAKLDGVPDDQRSAHFICTLALVRHANDPDPLLAIGRWYGRILTKRCGQNGFGYDPIFYVPEQQCSAAELPNDIKNRISHRGIASQQLLHALKSTELTHAQHSQAE